MNTQKLERLQELKSEYDTLSETLKDINDNRAKIKIIITEFMQIFNELTNSNNGDHMFFVITLKMERLNITLTK